MKMFQGLTSRLMLRKIESLDKSHYASVQFPDEIEEDFDNLIGMKSEKEALTDALNFFEGIAIYSENEALRPNTRFLLGGALGSGKSPLIRSLAKKANVPLVTCFLARWPLKSQKKILHILKDVFDIVEYFSDGCILTFEHFGALPSYQEEKGDELHNYLAAKIQESENAVVILETASANFALAPFYLEHDMFNINRVITVMPPTLESRKELFAKYLKNYGIELNEELVTRLAKNTMGMYPKDIEYIVQETLLRATRTETSQVSFKDFHETILQMDAGQESHNKMTEEERTATAYHEAGHVIAAYYSNPKYILGRVEITPRAGSLGLTLEEAGDEKYSFFKKDFEYEIIYSFGGMAAEKLIYGQTSAGVSSDLESANSYATTMIMQVGMDEDLGPIVFDDEYGFSSNKYYDLAEEKVQKLLKDLLQKTYVIVSAHKAQLEALAKALIEREVLVGDEIKQVLVASEEEEKAKNN